MVFFQTAIQAVQSIIMAFQPGRLENRLPFTRKGEDQMDSMRMAVRAIRRITRRKYIRRLIVPP